MRLLGNGILRFGGNAPGWTAATIETPGRSPWQPLGRVFDTRPDECAYQPEVVEALKPTPAPGGVVLRAQYPSSSLEAERFTAWGPCAIQLFVAAWDFFDPAAIAATWPGPKAESGHGFTAPWADKEPASLERRVVAWATNVMARNVLDVAPYLAQAGCEVDLGELAGGARYVMAWWRAVSVLSQGSTDRLDGVTVAVPWSLRAGAARHPCHRDRWCATLAIRSPKGNVPGPLEMADGNTLERLAGGFSAPIGGAASLRAVNGHNSFQLFTMLEEWAGGPRQQDTAEWGTLLDFEVKQALPLPVAGALHVYAGRDGPDDDAHCAALITVEVTR